MHSTTYTMRNGSWDIYIKLFVQIKEFNITEQCVRISNNIGIKFADSPLNSTEKFVESDMKYLVDGLNIIKNILSKYINEKGILIEINSIELWDIQYFQEEGLTMTIIKLMSEIYGFEMPKIPVHFDKQLNKYIFEF